MRNKKIFLKGIPIVTESSKNVRLINELINLTRTYLEEGIKKYKLVYEKEPETILLHPLVFDIMKKAERVGIPEVDWLTYIYYFNKIKMLPSEDVKYFYAELV